MHSINTRMFDKVTRTWNVVTGCNHCCVYCWCRNYLLRKILANPRLAKYYNPDFSPKFNPERLNVRFRSGELVFVCDCGDLFCDAVPDEWILKVLEVIRRHPRTDFLLMTKNPQRYYVLMEKYGSDVFSSNVWFGITVETDDDELYARHAVSRAPSPSSRVGVMMYVLMLKPRARVWVSIEPIIDFSSPLAFATYIGSMLSRAGKVVVYVGYDNYGILKKLGIPEPPLHKTLELINWLRQEGFEVRTKTLRKAWNEHQHNK